MNNYDMPFFHLNASSNTTTQFITGYKNEINSSNKIGILGDANNISESSKIFISGDENSVEYSQNDIIIGRNNILNGDNLNLLLIGENNNVTDTYNSFVVGVQLNNEGSHYTNIIGHGNGKHISGSYDTQDGDAFIIGNGIVDDFNIPPKTPSNAFRVTYGGEVYSLSAYNTSGADYAEYIFEWADFNSNNEDRIGYFVTVENKKLRIAHENDYVIGVVTGNPSIIGNSDEDYLHKWLRDDFNRPITEIVTTEDGEKYSKYVANPNYDPNIEYNPRKNRKEWDCVGLLGQLRVRDDGTCLPDGFCKCNNDGIATYTEEQNNGAYRVLERISDNIISILMK